MSYSKITPSRRIEIASKRRNPILFKEIRQTLQTDSKTYFEGSERFKIDCQRD